MANERKQPTPAQAEKAVENAREQLEEAQQIQAQVARGGLLPLKVKVLPDNTVKDEFGVQHSAGDEFAVDGLTAVGLAQGGHVLIVGTRDEELPDDEERRKASIKAEVAHLRARAKELESA